MSKDNKKQKMYTFASIIPLIGGITLGAQKALQIKPSYIASWGSVFGNNDKYCLDYYGSEVPYIELEEIDPSNLSYVDIVVSLPPCAGLSMGNSSKNRGCNAASNIHMMKSSEIAMKYIKPEAIIVENAPNLFSKAGAEFAERINNLAQTYEYSMSLIKTSSIKHGLPQERTRSFFILWRGKKVPLLEKVDKPYIPYHEYITSSMSTLHPHITSFVTHNEKKPSQDPLWQFIKTKFRNKSDQEIISELAHKRMISVWEIIYNNGWLAEAAQVVTDPKVKKWLNYTLDKKNKGLNIMDATQKIAWERTQALMWKSLPFLRHPHEDRWLMTSEALKLMGFPDDFIKKIYIPTSDSNVICQNCPVSTAADWVDEIIKALDGRRVWTQANGRILRQNNTSKSGAMKPIWEV